MVIGLLTVDDAQVAVSNLEEADFDPANISVVAGDADTLAGFSDISGPLTGIFDEHLEKKLRDYRIDDARIENYRQELAAGNVLLAVSGQDEKDDVIKEMLSDHSAREIKVIKYSRL